VCKNTLMCAATKFSISQVRCYFHRCPGRIEFERHAQPAEPPVIERVCANATCGAVLTETQLKYCSRSCGSTVRKRNHRLKASSAC
jgi:hypothetical protein